MILALHRFSGTPVWVNSDHVVTFGPEGYAHQGDTQGFLTELTLVNGDRVSVRETPADILLGLPAPKDVDDEEALERR